MSDLSSGHNSYANAEPVQICVRVGSSTQVLSPGNHTYCVAAKTAAGYGIPTSMQRSSPHPWLDVRSAHKEAFEQLMIPFSDTFTMLQHERLIQNAVSQHLLFKKLPDLDEAVGAFYPIPMQAGDVIYRQV